MPPSPLDQARPADILLSSFSRKRDLIIDFTVATALSNVEKAAQDPTFAMAAVIASERTKYAGRIPLDSDYFIFAVDSTGGIHHSAHPFIRRLAIPLSHNLGIPIPSAISRIVQSISFSVVAEAGRGMSRMR